MPEVDQAGAAATATDPLPGTFLGLKLDLKSDKLYDLSGAIPDVMGLRAILPRAAIVKVMSVPDSRCVRVVAPDDHVSIGFHEIIIHDMEDEELPCVALSELGCLRLDWPRALFTFMTRYQFDLDQMRKECRERFGSTHSGACSTCGKHIQQNLGRHVALYHMELAQLWRCPVTWCTVWKGTSQECFDHMRRAYDIPPLVKVANLTRWFPPWTVTRELLVQHDAAGCFGNSCGYSVVSPISGFRSAGYACGFPWYVNGMDAYFSGGIGCGVVTKESSSMRSGDCSMDVTDISTGHE